MPNIESMVSKKRKCTHCKGIRFRPAISWIHDNRVVIFICEYCRFQQYESLPEHIPDEQIDRYINAKV